MAKDKKTKNYQAPEEVTTMEKRKALPFALLLSTANNNYARLTFFSSIFVLFLSDLGFSNTRIGFLLGLVHVTGIFTPLFTSTIEKIGPKKAFLIGNITRVTVSAGLLLTPWILNAYGTESFWIFITVMIGIFAIFRTFMLTGWHPWGQEYVPSNIRGKYSAINNIVNSLSGFLTITVTGYVLNKSTEMRTFMMIFGTAIIFAVIAIVAATFVPGGAPIVRKEKKKNPFDGFQKPLKDKNYLKFLFGVSMITLATSPVASFISLFMLDKIGLTTGEVVYLSSATTLGAVLSSYIWGWASDRYGSKPVLQSGVFLYILLPIFYFFMPRGESYSFMIALGISFYAGIAAMGWSIGLSRQLNVNMIPIKQSTSYMAIWSAVGGLTWGLSKLIGGTILDLTKNLSGIFLGRPIDSYSVLFVIALLLPILAYAIMQFVKTGEENVSVGEFVGMFFHGRPFMAFNSMIRFHRAKDEDTAIHVTEQLGQSKSPLTVDELLIALADPRFYVRFEAVVSIAHHGEDPRLTKALANVLERGEPALSVVSAWALSKTESDEAKEALRHSMHHSRYRSVQAHAARSLSMVNDQESAAYFLQRAKEETDIGMRIAFSSALGKLKIKEAIPVTIKLLEEINDNFLRNEIALALARNIGDDVGFIRLIRDMEFDLPTTVAQAISDHKKIIRKVLFTLDIEEALKSCESYLAKGEFIKGINIWSEILEKISNLEIAEHFYILLNACIQTLRKEGLVRPEYFILSICIIDALNYERKKPQIEI